MRTFTRPETYQFYRDDSPDTPSGVSCVVFNDPDHPGRVIKCYRDRSTAKIAKKLQIEFWKAGLAPEVFDDVRTILAGEEFYSFSCEKVKTFRKRPDGSYGRDIDAIRGPFRPKALDIKEICDRLCIDDCHLGNFGIKGDRIVLIDFGPDSMSGYVSDDLAELNLA